MAMAHASGVGRSAQAEAPECSGRTSCQITFGLRVNGYGVIGKRVADAVRAQPDMHLVGISDITSDYRVKTAVVLGLPRVSCRAIRPPPCARWESLRSRTCTTGSSSSRGRPRATRCSRRPPPLPASRWSACETGQSVVDGDEHEFGLDAVERRCISCYCRVG